MQNWREEASPISLQCRNSQKTVKTRTPISQLLPITSPSPWKPNQAQKRRNRSNPEHKKMKHQGWRAHCQPGTCLQGVIYWTRYPSSAMNWRSWQPELGRRRMRRRWIWRKARWERRNQLWRKWQVRVWPTRKGKGSHCLRWESRNPKLLRRTRPSRSWGRSKALSFCIC